MNGRGPVLQELGEAARRRAHDRDRHPRRVRRPGAGLASGATRATRSTCAARRRPRSTPGTTAALFACGGIERDVDDGRQRQPRRRPGRPAGHAAPARRRLLDDHQRRQGRARRTSGMQIEDGNGVMLEEIRTPRAPPRHVRRRRHQDAIMAGLHGAATADGRHLERRLRGLPVPRHALRQDRHGRARAQPRPVLVRLLRRRTRRGRSWSSTTIERGGFGAETAAPAARLILNEWFDLKDDEFHAGSDQSN